MNEPLDSVYQVTHAKDGVETIYLVTATSERDAKTQVLDSLYKRHRPISPPYTDEEMENDAFGLKRHAMLHGNELTNSALCKRNGCSLSVKPFRPDIYRLYTLDTKTGAMT